jgi:hypothetical protein
VPAAHRHHQIGVAGLIDIDHRMVFGAVVTIG